jgi:hypothetical protein
MMDLSWRLVAQKDHGITPARKKPDNTHTPAESERVKPGKVVVEKQSLSGVRLTSRGSCQPNACST